MRTTSLVFLLAAFAGCGDDDATPPRDGGPTGDGPAAVDGGADAGSVDCTGRPADAPGARGEVAGVLDEARGRIVVFGGNTSAPVMCSPRYTQTDELWAFELDCNTWRQITPPLSPPPRSRHAVAYDSMRQRMILFAGQEGDPFAGATRFNDVWALDLATDAWEELITTGTPPSPRAFPAMVYDAGNDRLLVHGGDSGGFNGLGDMYALDLATLAWSELDTTGGPSARLYHGAVVHEGQMVVFGGAADFSTYVNDVWAFDLAAGTWSNVCPGGAGAPANRFGAQIWSDVAGGRIYAFGGHDDTTLGNSNDVQAFSFATDAWAIVRPGDTLNGVPIGMCDFPADFTLPEEGMYTPERRHSFVVAQSATTGYALFGKTDCGNINDVWALDFATGNWRILRPPTGGEACNRTGATSCAMLCF